MLINANKPDAFIFFLVVNHVLWCRAELLANDQKSFQKHSFVTRIENIPASVHTLLQFGTRRVGTESGNQFESNIAIAAQPAWNES
jgi:hypothetical protein